MERTVAKQVSYGRACSRCKAYFVTTKSEEYVCPWCLRIESGLRTADIYEIPERLRN